VHSSHLENSKVCAFTRQKKIDWLNLGCPFCATAPDNKKRQQSVNLMALIFISIFLLPPNQNLIATHAEFNLDYSLANYNSEDQA